MTTRTSDQAYLDQIISRPREGTNLEFKEAAKQFDSRKLFEYCAALANEFGGLLVLGVTDKLPRRVCGTEAFGSIESIEHQIYVKLQLRVLVRELNYEGKRVLMFQIPPRPVGTPVVVDGKYPMRAGESLVGMTPDHLRRILDEPKGH